MASWKTYRGSTLREMEFTNSLASAFPEISFSFNKNEFEKLAQKFAKFPGAIKNASFEATEKTRTKTRAAFVREFTSLVTLTPAYIRKGVKSRKARWLDFGATAEIRIVTGRLPLIRYSVSPSSAPDMKGIPAKQRQRVTYRLRKSGSAFDDAPESDKAVSGAKLFVQKMDSGHLGVFFRTGKKAFMEQSGPSLQFHASAEGFLPKIESLSRSVFKTAFLNEAAKLTGLKN